MFKKTIAAKTLVLGAFATCATSVMAAVPKEVTDALAASKADAVVVAAAALVIIVAIVGFKYMRRAL
ncbi:major capsid protein [Cupriavidus sp. H18C2]|uniref:major capsid protein n=1 Tax=Cupriavidus sp. H18C2 TaxID=3241602 RepID=UPI003BF876AF